MVVVDHEVQQGLGLPQSQSASSCSFGACFSGGSLIARDHQSGGSSSAHPSQSSVEQLGRVLPVSLSQNRNCKRVRIWMEQHRPT